MLLSRLTASIVDAWNLWSLRLKKHCHSMDIARMKMQTWDICGVYDYARQRTALTPRPQPKKNQKEAPEWNQRQRFAEWMPDLW